MDELQRLDWNLVPALDALLQERNVSRAARRLGISQSAASGALARLRRHFDDDLLTRRGSTYELTSTAQRLAPQAREAVAVAASLLSSAKSFDPASGRREFTVVSSEYGQVVHGASLVALVASSAPGVRISFRGMEARTASDDWLSRVDGWQGPRDSLTNTPSTGAAADRWVCVVDRDSPLTELSLDDVHRHRWILPTVARDRDVPWRKRLSSYGIDLDVAVTTESFGSVPFLVAGTAMLGVMQERLADRLADAAAVRVLPCPWEMRPLTFTFWWDPAREHDPAHVWLREQVDLCLTGAPPGGDPSGSS
jgi:DNA-binding transcriptional LysR family regulator